MFTSAKTQTITLKTKHAQVVLFLKSATKQTGQLIKLQAMFLDHCHGSMDKKYGVI